MENTRPDFDAYIALKGHVSKPKLVINTKIVDEEKWKGKIQLCGDKICFVNRKQQDQERKQISIIKLEDLSAKERGKLSMDQFYTNDDIVQHIDLEQFGISSDDIHIN